jgi:hypothetical protein
MVKAPGILDVLAFLMDFWNRVACSKIAAFGGAHRRVGAAEGCDLLIFRFSSAC